MVELWEMAGLGITYVFSTLAFVLFTYFVNKLIQIKKTTREILPFLGICIQFLSIGFAFLIISWFDYLRWEKGLFIFELHKIHTAFLMITFASLIFLCEYFLKRTKYIITAYVILGTIINLFISNFEIYQYWSLIMFIPIIIVGPLVWFWIFIKPTSGFLSRRLSIALLGLIFMIVGIGGRMDFVTAVFGIQIYVIGSLIMIFGLCLFGYGFTALSTFSDLGWNDKLREIFVISKNGISLYAFSFEKALPIKDSDLVAGGFSGIQLLLSEMVKTNESLQLINYQNLKIMIEQGEDVMFILILKEESKFLQYKLKMFSNEFRAFFKDVLPRWTGDIEVFRPTKTLIERIFELHSF